MVKPKEFVTDSGNMGRKKMAKKKENRYEGKYIATSTFNSKSVVASGKDPIAVRERAVAKGFGSPVVMYVAKRGSFNLY